MPNTTKLYIPLLLSLLFLVQAPRASADYMLDLSGYLTRFDSIVLGDETEVEVEIEEESEDEVEKEAETLRETQKQTFEQSRERSQKQYESRRETEKKKLESQMEINKRMPKQKVETRISSDRDKLELRQELSDQSGRMIEKKLELEKFESLDVEQEDGSLTKISPEINRLQISKDRLKARTDLDLKVGEKNEITVTLPNGKEKEIVVPEKALNHLVEKGILSSSGEGEDASYALTAGKNGEPVYKAEGVVEKRVFGLFKMKVNQKLEVAASDAEDGTTVAGDIIDAEVNESNPVCRFFARFAF